LKERRLNLSLPPLTPSERRRIGIYAAHDFFEYQISPSQGESERGLSI